MDPNLWKSMKNRIGSFVQLYFLAATSAFGNLWIESWNFQNAIKNDEMFYEMSFYGHLLKFTVL